MNPRLQIIDLDSDSQEEPAQTFSSIQTKKLFSQDRFKSDIISKNTYFQNQQEGKVQYDKINKKQQTNAKKQQYKTFKRISKYNRQQTKQQVPALAGKQLFQQNKAIEKRPISKFIEENQEQIILSTQLPPVRSQKKTSQLMKIQLTSSQQDSDIEEIKCDKKNNPEKSEQQQQQISQEKSAEKQKQKIVSSDVVISKRQFIQKFKDKKKRLRLNIKRDKTGFNRFWTRYDITFAGDCRYLASIQKSISATSTNYLISLSTDDFQNSENFLGRVRKGMLSSQYIIYDSSQKQVNSLGKKSKNIIGTMCFGAGQQQGQQGPRNFIFYCLKDPYKYADLQGISKQQIPLDKLYEIPENKQKIHVFHNRKAIWCKKLQGFVMDFNNRIDKASVKNMIMEDQNSQQILMFGRIGDDLFTLDVSYPLTPLIAFGIAATVFDYKSTVYG